MMSPCGAELICAYRMKRRPMSDTKLEVVNPYHRGLIGEVISRLERRGLKLVGMKLMQMDDALARQHYGEHVDRPFFPGLVAFITSSPVVAMVWEADNAVVAVRSSMGQTNPTASPPGTATATTRTPR